jgi:lysophospholipase L1-like esterase
MKILNKNIDINEIKLIYFLILVSLLIIIFSLYNEIYKHNILHEGMNNNTDNPNNDKVNYAPKNTIVLMGDSILKNNPYVGKGKSVEDILKQQYDGKIINLAKDNSTVKDLYKQINKLSQKYNNSKTTIFVSAGGNDILNNYVYVTNADIDNFKPLYNIYINYKDALKTLRDKFPKSKIMLVNLYYPQSIKYLRYRELIKKWNDLLFEYQNDPINGINDVLDLSLIMTDINDFSLCIEPSENGSVKISREILILSKE